jgi:NADPH2:quinone reductase
MHAVGYEHAGLIDRDDALIDLDLPEPVALGRDLLVEVRAVSVNPVDVLIRANTEPPAEGFRVLGCDAAGKGACGPRSPNGSRPSTLRT